MADVYERALARMAAQQRNIADGCALIHPEAEADIRLLRAAVELEQARYTTLGHEEDAAKARFRTALAAFAGAEHE